jgi:hypothetical protein
MRKSYSARLMTLKEPEHGAHEHGQEKDPMCDPPGEYVFNMPHYHAFLLLGKQRLFACHLTQLFCEIHRYQIVLEISLPDAVRSALIREREAHPSDSYFLGNTSPDKVVGNICDDPMTIPELAARLRTYFVGNIFRGIPFQQEYDHWPWDGVRPVFANIPVFVQRIVHFRPFSDTMNYPSTLTYLLFGAEEEAHVVHYQTKEPDYDHIASLRAAPTWLAKDLLAAGVLVDTPDVPRLAASDQSVGVRCSNPFKDGSTIQVRYRGADPRRPITIDHTFWFCTKVSNKEDPCTKYEHPCGSPTPADYMSVS